MKRVSKQANKRLWAKNRSRRGIGLTEAVCSGLIMILLLLAFMDLGSLIVAQYVADGLAYNTCRAASSCSSQGQASMQANMQLQQFKPSALISSVAVTSINFQPNQPGGQYIGQGMVTVHLQTTVALMAPVPFLPSQVQMQEQAVMPVLANLN